MAWNYARTGCRGAAHVHMRETIQPRTQDKPNFVERGQPGGVKIVRASGAVDLER